MLISLKTTLVSHQSTYGVVNLALKVALLDEKFILRLAAFYMYREDMQLKAWKVEDQKFTGYIDNASSGENYGLEIEGMLPIN